MECDNVIIVSQPSDNVAESSIVVSDEGKISDTDSMRR